jgi:hypothetical protein
MFGTRAVLQSIHRTLLELRKVAAGYKPTPRANLNSEFGSVSEFTGSFAGASSAGGAAGTASLSELGAKAEAAASRPLVLSCAVDSSLQAVQAAKQSLQSMHDKDAALRLFSQSVKEVLERTVSTAVICCRPCSQPQMAPLTVNLKEPLAPKAHVAFAVMFQLLSDVNDPG